MANLYTSTHHLLIHGPNSSLGNHVQHVLYLYNFAQKQNLNLHISCQSNLNDLFDIELPFKPIPANAICLFKEEYGGNPVEYYNKELKNHDVLKIYLETKSQFPEDFWLEGWFWNYDLMPNNDFFTVFKIKHTIQQAINGFFPEIYYPTNLTIHYRGTDFRNCSHGWGDIRLSFEYYLLSVQKFQQIRELKTMVLVSDEPKELFIYLKQHFPDVHIITSNSPVQYDWAILLNSINLVSSNSSFCWTAGLFNKQVVFQPKNFFFRGRNEDICFPPYSYYKNAIII